MCVCVCVQEGLTELEEFLGTLGARLAGHREFSSTWELGSSLGWLGLLSQLDGGITFRVVFRLALGFL